MNKKVLIIAGVTATGKTSLGLLLAKKFNGEIISADSRQVYKGMDIGTGKDLPVNVKCQMSNVKCLGKNISYYTVDGIKVWGYDLVEPDDEFSIAHYQQISNQIIENIWKRGKLPIAVGGTGFYLKVITGSIETIGIPPDEKLRKKLNKLSIKELQKKLKILNLKRYKQMNKSDRNNLRRLIRAIEIAGSPFKGVSFKGNEENAKDILWIGLKAPRKILYRRIDERVDERIKQGTEKEVKNLIKEGYTFDLPAMSGMGYRQWQSYFQGKVSRLQVIKRWKLDEHAYARRQLTWFKKNNKLEWFDITDPKYREKVVSRVHEWYSE